MAIVKELLDRMDGTIQIDSVENQVLPYMWSYLLK